MAEATKGTSLRFIISSNTRNRVQQSIFKYEVPLIGRQRHRRLPWCKANCPKGQVVESAQAVRLSRMDTLQPQCAAPREPTRPSLLSTDFLEREAANWR